jgi:Tol biopolymer transport system component
MLLRCFVRITVTLGLAGIFGQYSRADDQPRLIGFTQLRTDLPGGRLKNVRTMRAMVVAADGSKPRELAAGLIERAENSTQFAGWSLDGSLAVINRGWESDENGAWEEENKTFRFSAEGYLLDALLVDPVTGRAENVTAVDRVSFYNSGLFFWPRDPTKLGFTALIDGNSHPFQMDRDGRNKIDLTNGSKEFTYGFSGSPDGKRIAYHKSYQVYLADADGSNATRIETGQRFNFVPTWSPDGRFVMFLSGEHYDCDPYVVAADGTGLRKLADRGGYKGVVEFLDVPDFHGGSSDVPVWDRSGSAIFHTAQVGDCVELVRTTLDGVSEQLTHSPARTLHYHPQPSPDGERLVYGSKRDGVRQLFVMRLSDRKETAITRYERGEAGMWPHWQPKP